MSEVQTLTAEQVRRLTIADGWHFLPTVPEEYDPDTWFVYRKGVRIGHVFAATEDEALDAAIEMIYEPSGGAADRQIPDWLSDTGAALVLCLDIMRERGVRLDVSLIFIDIHDQKAKPVICARFLEFYGKGIVCEGISDKNTPAEALARLALAALEAHTDSVHKSA